DVLREGQDVAIGTENFLEDPKLALRKDRRAQPVHAVGVGREKALHALVDLARQARLDSLAHHGALLARNLEHVALEVGIDRFPESDIQIRPLPVGMLRRAVAEFEVIDAAALRQIARRRLERAPRPLALGRNAAVDAERQPDERVPEQQTLHLGERQHAFDPAAGFGVEEMSLVPELPLDYGLPSGPGEEG